MINKTLHKRLATHCKAAYGRYISPLYNSERIEIENDQCIIGYDNVCKKIVIAFRGSDHEWKDWRSNFRFICRETDWGDMHRGFYNSSQKLMHQLIRKIESLKKIEPDAKIILTGHSRGGSMACTAAYFLHLANIEIEQIVTFGAPKFAQIKASKKFDFYFDIIRYENRFDFVPKLPFWSFGFRHVGKRIKLKTKKHDLDNYIKGVA